MKVINKKEYNYPVKKSNKWRNETFQPLSDLKLRVKLKDNNVIECAAFHMIMDGRVENHACVSTQVGCKYGCKFCTSGENGYLRNLSKKEMRGELKALCQARNIKKFDCIVFMGIGEPLDNYKEVVPCIEELMSKKDLYSGIRRIALATVGVPNLLSRLAKESLDIDIWISLHSVSDVKRKKIMPIAHKYSVLQVVKAAESYVKKVGRFVWLNYMVFLEFNNTNEDAKEMAKLLKGKEDLFKIIITEPNNNIDNFKKAEYRDLVEFEDKLKRYGVKNEIVKFMTAGKDVDAGCGEFVFTRSDGMNT